VNGLCFKLRSDLKALVALDLLLGRCGCRREDLATEVAARFCGSTVNRRCPNRSAGTVVLLVVGAHERETGIGDPARRRLYEWDEVGNGCHCERLRSLYQSLGIGQRVPLPTPNAEATKPGKCHYGGWGRKDAFPDLIFGTGNARRTPMAD